MSSEPTSLEARHWIDGAWLALGEQGESIDPASGGVIGTFYEADAAIAAASRAFKAPGWRDDRALRARVLNSMAARFSARDDDVVRLLGRENGKVHAHGHLETSIVPETLRFNAALALTDQGRAAAIGELSIVLREPAGVAGIIAPWNSPVALVIRSLAPALAAGCTAAVMLPRQTAQVNTLIAEIIAGTPELPKGVVNIFTGGHTAGDTLVKSPDVPVISFTGSSQTGRDISANAAPHLKRLGLELGGKTPMIVFDDADLDAAAAKITQALIVFAGQFCMTGSRLLVQASVADRLRALVAEQLEAVKLGPASDPEAQMGPLIDRANVERIDKLVTDAIGEGAEAVVRGGPVTGGPLATGAFYRRRCSK